MPKPAYRLEQDQVYMAEARAGPLDSKKYYLMPIRSSIDPRNPLRSLLEGISLETAKRLARETGQHIKVSLIVEEESTD